jgi:cell division protein FtsW
MNGAPFIATTQQATRLEALRGRFEPWLLGIAIALACFGLVMVASSSIAIGEGLGVGPFYFLTRHVLFLAIGIGLAVWLMRTELKSIEQQGQWLLLACFVLLLLVFVPGIGRTVNGARRWLNLGVSFQPSEFAKIALIAWTAALAVKKQDKLHSLSKGLVPFLVVWLPVVALVLLEPNMSAALLLLLLSALVLFAGGARIGHFIFFGLLAVPVVWHQITHAGYRMQRIAAFLDPTADTDGVSYQIYQSLIAVGSGGLGGVGFGGSRQKFGFLPEPHNDFLFSMIAEEWGLLGIVFVVAVFAGFLWVGYRIASRAPDRFGYLLAIGMTNMIAVSGFLHMGVALSLLPTTGVALPFMSYGRSALLAQFCAVGILLSVARSARRGPA